MNIRGKNDNEQILKKLQRLEQYDVFMKERVTYCGHEIERKGLWIRKDKFEALLNALLPKNDAQLRSFLG